MENYSRIAELIHTLGSEDNDMVTNAVEALSDIGEPAMPALLKALSDENKESVRSNAALTLGEIGNPGAVPALIRSLDDEAVDVRVNAALALGQIGKPAKEAMPALEEALNDENEDVRANATWALQMIGEGLPQEEGALVRNIARLPGESRVTQVGGLLLTNRRVVFSGSSGSEEQISVAMVDDVDSVVASEKIPSIWFIIIGVVGIVAAIALFSQRNRTVPGIISVLVGIGCIAVFFLWRERTLTLTVSGSPLINLAVSELGDNASQAIDDFINQFFKVKSTLN